MLELAKEIVGGRRLTREEDCSFLLEADINELCEGADYIRKNLCGTRADLCAIINGKSGACSENCKFCSQSAHHHTACQAGDFIDEEAILSGCREAVNIDGNANRVAALCYGPESVLVIAGMNKVMGDLDSAIARARQVAAPANAQRFDIKTPCAVTGSCGDCTSPDCICCQMVITRACRPAGRIKVILVGQDLGF